MSKRLGIFISHPIQYYTPIWRRLAAVPGLSIRVHFFSDHSVRGGVDPYFKIPVAWDRPLLDGYDHCFISRHADLSRRFGIALPNARATLRDGQFDYVLIAGYTQRFEIQVVRAARKLGIPVLQRGDVHITRPWGTKWYRRILRHAYIKWFYGYVQRFCYVGQVARRHFIHYGVPEEQMFFSPESVDSDFFEAQHEQLDREECRRGLGIEPGQFVVLYCGKFNPVKDPCVLLKAVARLKNRERLTLVMVGEGELRNEIQAKAREILGQRAIFPGFVNQTQLGRYYRAADILVLPSISESWGLVVNEAMHFGLPAIVSAGVSCGPDLVREGQTGFVFPVGNDEKLAAYLDELLAAPESCERMGRAAREHIRGYTTAVTVQGIKQAMDVV